MSGGAKQNMTKDFKGMYGATKGGGIASLLGVTEPAQQPAEIKPDLAEIDRAVERLREKPKRGRPKTNFRETEKSSQEGCKEAETRATFIVNEADLEKIKAVAYWERLPIKEVIGAAIRGYVEKYEAKNGAVKPVSRSK
jgi:hypothetical protein